MRHFSASAVFAILPWKETTFWTVAFSLALAKWPIKILSWTKKGNTVGKSRNDQSHKPRSCIKKMNFDITQ